MLIKKTWPYIVLIGMFVVCGRGGCWTEKSEGGSPLIKKPVNDVCLCEAGLGIMKGRWKEFWM